MQIEYRAPRNIAELNDSIFCSMCAFDCDEGGFSDDHFFSRILKLDPWYDLNNTRACFVDGQVASVVVIFERPMRIGSSVVRMGGLGSVGTHPDHRKKGYSSQVLLDTADYLESASFDLSMLFTGTNRHYAKAGWVTYPVTLRSIDLSNWPQLDLAAETTELSIETCNYGTDLPILVEIYNQFNKSRTGTTVRNQAYWENQPEWRGQDPALFWVARQNGQVVAYLKGGEKEILEIGRRLNLPNGVRVLAQLMVHFLQNRVAANQEQIQVNDCAEIRQFLDRLGLESSTRETTHFMFRITNFRSLLEKICPMLEHRLRTSELADWKGKIQLQYELDTQTLTVSDRQIRVESNTDSPTINLTLSQLQVLQLIFGELDDSILADHPILLVFFPPDQLLHWSPDNF